MSGLKHNINYYITNQKLWVILKVEIIKLTYSKKIAPV